MNKLCESKQNQNYSPGPGRDLWWECNSKDHGGLDEVLNYEANFNQYLKNKDSIWNSLNKYVFKQLGNLEFLLEYTVIIQLKKKYKIINKLLWHGRWSTNIISHQRGTIFGTTKTSYTKINL